MIEKIEQVPSHMLLARPNAAGKVVVLDYRQAMNVRSIELQKTNSTSEVFNIYKAILPSE